ncbi:MAG: biliverdin-producing heme oxygenase, partial [Desulfovibrionales bacterium]|nr:biliverdin-producing heme oxygenase [Desulfovibrionales bacterium]
DTHSGQLKTSPELANVFQNIQVSLVDSIKTYTKETHEKVHNTEILKAIHGQTVDHDHSHNFHAGLLTLYSKMDSYLEKITHEPTRTLLEELSRTSRLTEDCKHMAEKTDRRDDTYFRNLNSMQAYLSHLETIESEPERLLTHFYVHLGGVLAGGQIGKTFLSRIHGTSELTHYDFDDIEGGAKGALEQLRAAVNNAPINFIATDDVFRKEAETAFQLSLKLYQELYIPDAMDDVD